MSAEYTGLIGVLISAGLVIFYLLGIRFRSKRSANARSHGETAVQPIMGNPVIGDRILAMRHGMDDTLELDTKHYYFTHDTGGDLCAWHFKKPAYLTEEQLILKFNNEPRFLTWLENQGVAVRVTQWW